MDGDLCVHPLMKGEKQARDINSIAHAEWFMKLMIKYVTVHSHGDKHLAAEKDCS